jgi:hypothetical protein
MKNLPDDVQGVILKSLDPKSTARLRATSKEMKTLVDDSQPPTGSYTRKTGRFQKRFSYKGMATCVKKHQGSFSDMADIQHHAEIQDFGWAMYRDFRAAYKRNTLFRDFRSLTRPQTQEEHWTQAVDIFPELKDDAAFRRDLKQGWIHETKEKTSFRRRVIRLLKAWAATDSRYKDTLALARRRTSPYTLQEEQTHKDRLMDAIIVQSALIHPADDPTRTMLDNQGKPMTLNQKIDAVVKKCRTTLHDQKNQKKAKKKTASHHHKQKHHKKA